MRLSTRYATETAYSLRVLKPKQSRRLSPGGDHAITNRTTNAPALQSAAERTVHLCDDWFDPIEAGVLDWDLRSAPLRALPA
jgi:hypothetical protein